MVTIDKFLNIPYKFYGRNYDGCDCLGLTYLFFRDMFNKELPCLNGWEYSNKYEDEYDTRLEDNLLKNFSKEQSDIPFSILMYGFGITTHIGIKMKDFVLHSLKRRNKSTIESIRFLRPYLRGELWVI